jgi:hypothetical protein
MIQQPVSFRVPFTVASLGLFTLALAACSSGASAPGGTPPARDDATSSAASNETVDYCTAKSRCPNEPTPTDAQLAECHKVQSDPKCGAKLRVGLACAYAKETCLDDGTTDGNANAAACKTELDPWIACATNK